jgi:tetratricopeptide (TPR) repeat protein
LYAKDLIAAEATLDESARLSPHYKTLELLGEARLLQGKVKEAIVPLAAASALTRTARAHVLLAEALLALGKARNARDHAEIALQRTPHFRRAVAVMDAIENHIASSREIGEEEGESLPDED